MDHPRAAAEVEAKKGRVGRQKGKANTRGRLFGKLREKERLKPFIIGGMWSCESKAETKDKRSKGRREERIRFKRLKRSHQVHNSSKLARRREVSKQALSHRRRCSRAVVPSFRALCVWSWWSWRGWRSAGTF